MIADNAVIKDSDIDIVPYVIEAEFFRMTECN